LKGVEGAAPAEPGAGSAGASPSKTWPPVNFLVTAHQDFLKIEIP